MTMYGAVNPTGGAFFEPATPGRGPAGGVVLIPGSREVFSATTRLQRTDRRIDNSGDRGL